MVPHGSPGGPEIAFGGSGGQKCWLSATPILEVGGCGGRVGGRARVMMSSRVVLVVLLLVKMVVVVHYRLVKAGRWAAGKSE